MSSKIFFIFINKKSLECPKITILEFNHESRGEKMYCRNCGNQLDVQDSYCSTCGKAANEAKVNSEAAASIEYMGPPVESEEGVEALLEESFVGKKYDFYITKWNKLENKNSKISWNWATFFLGPFWFGYRKMYIPVLLIGVTYFLVDLFFYLIKYQFSEDNYFFDPVQNLLLFPFTIFLSLFGNYFYLKHTNRYINQANLKPFNNEQKKMWLKSKGGTSWISVLLTLLFIFFYGILSAFLLPTNVDQISTVKDGSFYDYPTTTIGNGFDNFFADSHWEYVASDSPYDVVRFTGKADQNGNEVEVIIDFILKDDSFEIHSATVNSSKITDDEINDMIETIFNSNDIVN